MYSPRHSLLCLSLALLSFASVDAAQRPQQKVCDEKGPKAVRLSTRHIESKGIGYNKGYTSFDLFGGFAERAAPYYPFFDVRMHVFNDGRFAANGGFGFRHLADCYILGGNLFYDYRATKRNGYSQIGMGLEYLSNVWDFHLNGYVPVGKIRSRFYDLKFDHFEDHYAIISQKREFAFYGANAEAGAHVIRMKDIDLYAGAGPYYFYGQYGKNAIGGKARIKGLYQDILGFELSGSYDSQFRGVLQGEISLTLPIGRRLSVDRGTASCKATCDRLYNLKERTMQRVERMEIIVIDDHKKRSPAINPATGDPYYFLFVNNTAGDADGSWNSPYAALDFAEAASAPGDILYVLAGNPAAPSNLASVLLKDNQRFWGSGVEQSILTAAGTLTIPAQTDDFPYLLTGADGSGNLVALNLANGDEISGFLFGLNCSSNTALGVLGNDVRGARIIRNRFINVGSGTAAGVSLGTMYGQVDVQDNMWCMNPNSGTDTFYGVSLQPQTGDASYDISDNVFTGVNEMNIQLLSSNSSRIYVVVYHNKFENGGLGVFVNAAGTSVVTADIEQNQFDQMGYLGGGAQPPVKGSDVTLISQLNAEVLADIIGNEFTFNNPFTSTSGKDVVVETLGNGSCCVQFDYNTAQGGMQGGTYEFSVLGGVLRLENPQSNIGTFNIGSGVEIVTSGSCD